MKDIATITRTNEILNKNNLRAKKKFGQNFLIDSNIIDNIVSKSDITKDTCVIEIGPGLGALTEKLAQAAKKVIAFEIDESLKPVLTENLGQYKNIEIIYKDFLTVDLASFVDEILQDCKEVRVVANLPYYITTPILIKIFESNTKIKSITAMMQKEVGERLSAKPSTKEYNNLTILTQFYSDAKIVINVPSTVFVPKPNVDSVVARFDLRKNELGLIDDEVFFKVVRASFRQRRKTILNNLAEFFGSKDKAGEILNTVGINPSTRAEAIDIKTFVRLSNEIKCKN